MITGIILCARLGSQRFPNKIIQAVAGQACFEHLLDRLKTSSYKTIVALPTGAENDTLEDMAKRKGIEVYRNPDIDDEDVLGRIVAAAEQYHFDNVVRVTHDDIFIDIDLMECMIDYHINHNADHTECPQAPRGTDSEVFRLSALKLAAEHTSHLARREHIRYYVKRKPFHCYEFPYDYRLALDYREDFQLIEYVFNRLYKGTPIDLGDVRKLFYHRPNLLLVNKLPVVSIYIPCFNYGKYLNDAIDSVLFQTFTNWELLIFDDFSTDSTREVMKKYENYGHKVKLFYNEHNLGLIKTADRAITEARGEYVMRLDADDYLEKNCLETMVAYMKTNRAKGMVYSDYMRGGEQINAKHKRPPHPACSLVKRNAFNDIRYNEAIKMRDGLDFWLKFCERFEYGYINQPLWNYRYHGDSLSQKAEALATERKILDEWAKNKKEEIKSGCSEITS